MKTEYAVKSKALHHIISLYEQHEYEKVISAIDNLKDILEKFKEYDYIDADISIKELLNNIHPLPDILACYFKLNEL